VPPWEAMEQMNADLIQQKQAEELRDLKADLLDDCYEPTIAWELDGSIVYWNGAAEELYGFSSAQAVGGSVHWLLHTVFPIPLEDVVRQLESQNSWSGELTHVTREGLGMCVETHLKLIRLPKRRALVLQSDRDIGVYKQAESAMRQVYEELEKRVEERTHQLEAANKELESFSYSVSHDLRAPLRGLAGFARILTMDYAGKMLDERALDLMRRMTALVTRMGQLIEDLLKLSQVSRTPIHPQSLDVSGMTTAILGDLSARDPERTVNIQIEPGLTAVADSGLLRAVFENLLGNAWKFTGKTAAPQITVGVSGADGEAPAYFVEDNGAGFDMEFADQLFAPFQRLHDASEFEGTGVGLATVQRIIHRHGGRIWAESSPGHGAKFLFTLGLEGLSKRKKTTNDSHGA
jgi:PAS domain S-box-containing protein